MISWLKKFKYISIKIEEITWNCENVPYNRASIIFQQNGFGKRKVIQTKNQMPSQCPVETHPYWHKEVLPWLNYIKDIQPEKRKNNVIKLVVDNK